MAINKHIVNLAIDSDMFTYKNGVFSAERSDFNGKGDLNLHQIYDDAIDVGFAMKSKKTGNIVIFYESHMSMSEGDILYWKFNVIPEHIRKHPHLRDVCVMIFND